MSCFNLHCGNCQALVCLGRHRCRLTITNVVRAFCLQGKNWGLGFLWPWPELTPFVGTGTRIES
jgi:hypothetical protein